MDAAEFRVRGKEMVDFIADYLENIKDRQVTPAVTPGFMHGLVPLEAPTDAQNWNDIMSDVESKIMPGITHWQHPRFHAYFPAGDSYPSILADMLATGLGINGFSWAASPSCTELETIVMHWLGTMCGLHESLLPTFGSKTTTHEDQHRAQSEPRNGSSGSLSPPSEQDDLSVDSGASLSVYDEMQQQQSSDFYCGGGVLLGSASECVLVSMLAARRRAINDYRRHSSKNDITVHSEPDGHILSRLVAYTSKLAHSCVEKAAHISLVKLRMLDVDESLSLRGVTLARAMREDLHQGLIPFYVCGTFGTTSCCSFDNVIEMSEMCRTLQQSDGIRVYLHCDGAYAGNALICEELRHYMRGIELLDSFNFNPNKWMLVNFDCSCLWVKDKYTLTMALSVDPTYLQHAQQEKVIDYRNWGIALSRKFRSLKLWFTIRSYGVKGLQEYIRQHVRLAKEFEQLVLADSRFVIVGKVTLGLVCFRLKGPNELSRNLLLMLNESGKIHMTPAVINDRFVIRFCVNAPQASLEDIVAAWTLICEKAEQALSSAHKPNDNETTTTLGAAKTHSRRGNFARMTSNPPPCGLLRSSSAALSSQVFSKTVQIDSSDEDDDEHTNVTFTIRT